MNPVLKRLILLAASVALGFTSLPAAPAEAKKEAPAKRRGLPFTAAIRVGDTHYISGWGSRDPKTGKHPEGFEAQTRQLLVNLRELLQRNGLKLADVVHTHAYVTYPDRLADFHRIYAEFFPQRPPALTTMGIPRLPATEVEITFIASHRPDVVAIQPAGMAARPHASAAIRDGDFLYVSDLAEIGAPVNGSVSEQARQSIAKLEAVLKAAGFKLSEVVKLELYLTDLVQTETVNGVLRSAFARNPPTRTVVGVRDLPRGAAVAINAIVARGGKAVKLQGGARATDDPAAIQVGHRLFLSGRAGTAGGGMAEQVREVMDELGRVLQAAGMTFSHVVKGKVYVADMEDYAAMNAAYGSYFTDLFPTRSCIEVGSLPQNAKVAITLTADSSPRR